MGIEELKGKQEQANLVLPRFVSGAVVRATSYFRIVMDYKPELQGQKEGERFYIVPLTDEAERMLGLAAKEHNISNFSVRDVTTPEGSPQRSCLRADFSAENLPVILLGEVDIPVEGEDSIPSIERMEECLKLHPDSYTFSG